MVATSASVGTLAINAAFLQEIKDCNPDLWQTQHQLRQVCESDSEPGQLTRQLVHLLDEFRDQISLQFALEESYGYQAISPNSTYQPNTDSQKVLKAHDQHCCLYLELTDLAERAEELQYRGVEIPQLRELIAATQRFDERLRQHEQLESELIDQSYGSI